jgi:hypothetical protein
MAIMIANALLKNYYNINNSEVHKSVLNIFSKEQSQLYIHCRQLIGKEPAENILMETTTL